MNVTQSLSKVLENGTVGPVDSGNDTVSSYVPTSMSPAFTTAYVVARVVIGILVLFGNSLTLHCIRTFENLQTNTNFLIANLCFADIQAGLLPIFLITTNNLSLSRQPVWIPVCLTGETLNIISTAANIWFIFWIAVDRYVYISRALHYSLIVTQCRVLVVVVATWIWILISAVITVYYFNRLQLGMPCRAVIFLKPIIYEILYFPQLILLSTLTVLLYCAIAWIAWRQKRQIHALAQGAHQASTTVRPDWKIVRMMAMVPGVYFASMFPAAIVGFINNRFGIETMIVLDRLTGLLWWTQAWVNPIIYAWKNEEFRRAFKKILRIKSSNIEPYGNEGAIALPEFARGSSANPTCQSAVPTMRAVSPVDSNGAWVSE